MPDALPAGLVGRPSKGEGDAFELVRDYFALVHGLAVQDGPPAADGFGVRHGHAPHDLAPGDLILMAIAGRPGVPDHRGVLMPSGWLLHHPPGRESVIEPFVGRHRSRTCAVFRHPAVRFEVPKSDPAYFKELLPDAVRHRLSQRLARRQSEAG